MVARGFAPAYTSTHLEPQAGDVVIPLKRQELDRRTPERVVRGRVLNENGDPVARAIVEPAGVIRGQGGRFGALDRLGIDVLAVTDDDGEFRLGVGEDGDALVVRIKAPFLAPATTEPLAAGRAVHTVTLGPGVTVTGRVVAGGRPRAGVGVGMVQVDRGVQGYLGHFEFGTGSKGRFGLVNIPPAQVWYLYGLMDGLKDLGSIPAAVVKTGAHGTTVDLGDLKVRPGYRLTGRVVLADGKPVPPGTRVLAARDTAWDSQTAAVGPDGRFSLKGLPPERFSLSTNVRGYHPSPRNASRDSLNPFRLLGMVQGDVDGLRFLLDPDPRPDDRRPSRQEMDEYGRRRDNPLRGAPDEKAP